MSVELLMLVGVVCASGQFIWESWLVSDCKVVLVNEVYSLNCYNCRDMA